MIDEKLNNYFRHRIIQKWILWCICFAIDLQDADCRVVLNYYEYKVSFRYYKKLKFK